MPMVRPAAAELALHDELKHAEGFQSTFTGDEECRASSLQCGRRLQVCDSAEDVFKVGKPGIVRSET
jgi:hypothetical protein